MFRLFHALAILAGLFLVSEARAQGEDPLTRDEVTVIKKKLVNILDALGQPPDGYTVEHENFNLPSEAYKSSKEGLYNLLEPSADRQYGTQRKNEQANSDFQKEYQKKLAEAQAKGDYAAMSQLAQEMQKKSGEMQLKASQGSKEPISVDVRFNSNPGVVIDPDAVLFEHQGVIALRSNVDAASGKERVSVFCDPVALRETKQLSKVDLKFPEGGVPKRTAMRNVTIEMSGPAAEVEPWAKRIDVKKALAQIDGGK